MRRIAGLLLFLCLIPGVDCLAQQGAAGAEDFDYVVQHLFWDDLYTDGGWSFYCGYHFNHDRRTRDGRIIDVEHIYPVDAMLRYVHCRSRLQCYESGNEKFRKMESDLHNLYPAWQELITFRYDKHYGRLRDGTPRFNDCNIEWRAGVLQPRPISRGNIARAYFYMHRRYGLPIPADMLDTLQQWNRTDPPSRQEKHRNNRIQQLQGVRNPYIDDPALAAGITLRAKR